jgi:hypothetical protein
MIIHRKIQPKIGYKLCMKVKKFKFGKRGGGEGLIIGTKYKSLVIFTIFQLLTIETLKNHFVFCIFHFSLS